MRCKTGKPSFFTAGQMKRMLWGRLLSKPYCRANAVWSKSQVAQKWCLLVLILLPVSNDIQTCKKLENSKIGKNTTSKRHKNGQRSTE